MCLLLAIIPVAETPSLDRTFCSDLRSLDHPFRSRSLVHVLSMCLVLHHLLGSCSVRRNVRADGKVPSRDQRGTK